MALSEADQKFLDQAFNSLLKTAGLPNGLTSFSLAASLVAAEGAVANKYSFAQDVTFQVTPETSGTGVTYTIKGAEGATGNSLVIAGGDGQLPLTDTGGSLTLRGGGVAVVPGNLNLQGSKENHPVGIYGNVNIGQLGTAAVDIGGPAVLLRSQSVALSLEDWSDTPGNVAVTSVSGLAAVALGTSSITVTNPSIAIGAIVFAWVQQAVADATLTQVIRTSVNPAGGAFTIYGNANATADTIVGWVFINPANVWEPPP